MKPKIEDVVREIAHLPQNWHGAGTISHLVLETIVQYAENQGEIERSAETGSGKTTLLLSHLSRCHTVFACDFGNSIANVRESSLFRGEVVAFVEGPTQLTLPNFTFDAPFDLVLLDGPHGYPFPDLEYYYFYPHLKEGGLLLVDDIQIPSIRRMFEIIAADDMFELLETVDNMAFFRRTAAPLFSPVGDNWWIQGYNKAAYEEMIKVEPTPERQIAPLQECPQPSASAMFMRRLVRYIPGFLKAIVPRTVKRRLMGK